MRRPLGVALAGLAIAVAVALPASADLTPSITTYPSSEPLAGESHPHAIAAGTDGRLWFTDLGHKIVRVTVEGRPTLQAPLPATSRPYGIPAGGARSRHRR